MAPLRVMFCGAHPDDAEIYAFGTLFAYAAQGAQIVLVLATAGEGGLTARSQHQPLAITRMAEAAQAAQMLGARLIHLGLPDGGLAARRMDLLGDLAQVIETESPDIILTHSPNDYHHDHRVLSAAVSFLAADRTPVIFVDNMKGRNFTPSHFVDITRFHGPKMLALRQHQSQKPRRYVLAATALAQDRAAQGGVGQMAEALRHDPNPAFKNIAALLPKGCVAAPLDHFAKTTQRQD